MAFVLMAFEVLDRTLMLFRRGNRTESAEVPPTACLWIFLPGIQPIFSRCEFSNHGFSSFISYFQ
jgi:hypothetical protein